MDRVLAVLFGIFIGIAIGCAFDWKYYWRKARRRMTEHETVELGGRRDAGTVKEEE